MSYNYNVGEKVACINDRFSRMVESLYDQLPVEGKVYVVRDMRLGIAMDCKTGEVSVLLVGITNPKSGVAPFAEFGFAGWRFVPLSEIAETSEQTREISVSKPKSKELVEA